MCWNSAGYAAKQNRRSERRKPAQRESSDAEVSRALHPYGRRTMYGPVYRKYSR